MRMLLSVLAIVLVGCSTSGTSVLIGDDRYSATDPERITMLVEPPEREHVIIALVEGEASTDDYFTKARTEAAAIKAMREEAARIGANAIVLTGKGARPYGSVVVGSGHTSIDPGGMGAFGSSVSTGLGWEKITYTGTAIRYVDGAAIEGK